MKKIKKLANAGNRAPEESDKRCGYQIFVSRIHDTSVPRLLYATVTKTKKVCEKMRPDEETSAYGVGVDEISFRPIIIGIGVLPSLGTFGPVLDS